jgi:methyltransferase (TIGR00027 family)
MELSEVSKTALTTLRCHAFESQKEQPLLRDPMAQYCFEQLVARASSEQEKRLYKRRLNPALVSYITLRARKYDLITNQFIAEVPSPTVVNLGCGFDTRYWRIDHDRCRYIELDLPEMVELKRSILGDNLCYEMIGCSVLDSSWIERVTVQRNTNFLLLAEGLFMYLPKAEVIALFQALAQRLECSRIALEVVADAYTRGIWKQLITMKMKRETGSDAGSFYNFGIRNAAELETYDKGIKVLSEWAYVDDPDVRPRIYKYMYMGMSRTQWTVIASIN